MHCREEAVLIDDAVRKFSLAYLFPHASSKIVSMAFFEVSGSPRPDVVLEYGWMPARAVDSEAETSAAVRESPPPAAPQATTQPTIGVVREDSAAANDSDIKLRCDTAGSGFSGGGGERLDSSTQPPHGVCYQFYRTGSCERQGCSYLHSRSPPSGGYHPSQSQSQEAHSNRRFSPTHASVSSSGSRSPRSYTTTRYGNRNDDPNQFGADYNYRPQGFNSNRACFSFQNGFCKFGSNCAFSHDMHASARPRSYQ